jgi:three-Cys-motif partner protein
MNDAIFNPILPVEDDGLTIGEPIGPWAEDKYGYVGRYCDFFTRAMQKQFQNLVYIDLFSGSGYSKIRDTRKILKSSPLISLSLPNKFTKYIFCELVDDFCATLRLRIDREFKNIDYEIIEGNCNENVQKIIDKIPVPSRTNKVLIFCFVDPFAASNFNFNTIENLSKYMIDFLILIPTGMEFNRWYKDYLIEENLTVDNYLNDTQWRDKFRTKYSLNNSDFLKFIADEFSLKMENFGYIKPDYFCEIRSTTKNLPLYHLAFYSKHTRGHDLWKKAKGYITKLDLF